MNGCLNRRNDNSKKMIKELYNDGSTKMKHGVFANIIIYCATGKKDRLTTIEYIKTVAKELRSFKFCLTVIRLWEKMRKEWKESEARRLNATCQFSLNN